MKTSKLFTIDVELAERLTRMDNASALINNLLKEYFELRGEKDTFFDQKRAVISDLKKNLKCITKKSKLLLSLKSLISIISRSIGLKKFGLLRRKSRTSNLLENTQEEEKS